MHVIGGAFQHSAISGLVTGAYHNFIRAAAAQWTAAGFIGALGLPDYDHIDECFSPDDASGRAL